MPKSTNSVASKARRKRILKKAKGYWGSRGNVLTVVKHAVDKAEQYAYRDRRVKKRNFRSCGSCASTPLLVRTASPTRA